jgi:hypothetical protein
MRGETTPRCHFPYCFRFRCFMNSGGTLMEWRWDLAFSGSYTSQDMTYLLQAASPPIVYRRALLCIRSIPFLSTALDIIKGHNGGCDIAVAYYMHLHRLHAVVLSAHVRFYTATSQSNLVWTKPLHSTGLPILLCLIPIVHVHDCPIVHVHDVNGKDIPRPATSPYCLRVLV